MPRSVSRPARARCRTACSSPTGPPTSRAAVRSWVRCPARWSPPRSPSSIPRRWCPPSAFGWSKVDAATICAARTKGAVDQLVRVLGPEPEGLADATELMAKAVEPLRPEGKPLFAGLRSLGLPGDPMGDMWRLADMLREYRGDAHTAAWTSAGLDATEVGLLTELYWGLPLRTYIRTRAWSDEQLGAAEARLSARGLLADGAFTDEGRALREKVEVATDAQCAVVLDALGDSVRCAARHPHPVGCRAPRRRCVPPAGPARPGSGSLSSAERSVLGAVAGRDEQGDPRLVDPGRVPHVGRVDHGVARVAAPPRVRRRRSPGRCRSGPRAGRRALLPPGAVPSRPRSRPAQ